MIIAEVVVYARNARRYVNRCYPGSAKNVA